MAAHRRVKKVSKAEQRSQRRRADQVTDGPVPPVIDVASQTTPKKPIPLPATIVIRDLAPRLEVPVGRVMQELLKNGIMATLNESIDFDTAAIIADELGFEAQHEEDAAP
ncbi:translation initiation factor IF-2 N-terminal domain-containing protein, partial [Candidatus Berkelbacteria bacterium]|nr:translation initiation factor IF-2 N-terminal domain-containing protein [Candidatus Berkelbacteria bacterium]